MYLYYLLQYYCNQKLNVVTFSTFSENPVLLYPSQKIEFYFVQMQTNLELNFCHKLLTTLIVL